MTCGIARIVCVPTGEGYVISSTNCELRMQTSYMGQCRNGTIGSVLIQDRFNRYGEDAFRLEILEVCPPQEFNARKQHYLNEPTGSELNRHRNAGTGSYQQ